MQSPLRDDDLARRGISLPDHQVLRTVAESNQGNAGVRANVLEPGYVRRGDAVRLE